VSLVGGYVGPGYGIPSAECLSAIRLVARTEGVFLDPVYSAKAMAGLIGMVEEGRIGASDTVLFFHTGGLPGLFALGPEIIVETD
jgi:1-aminocyclopropane-1-carboxylate deaminase/D-cysteine desulfhydrase-like pyridoxal-dependent ACC family enzyme